jgi:hypothetical protein
LSAPLTAIPNTPCPPASRSTTSSADVHSYTVVPSTAASRSPGRRPRAPAGARSRPGCSAARPRCRASRLTTLRRGCP